MSYAALFPGQGSQFVGMGEDLFLEHPAMLGKPADDILGWSLQEICLNGPEDKLTRTEHAQPALYALSCALWASWRVLASTSPTAAAGHSLGEYSALFAAGVLDFEDGLRLVAERGRAMAAAADREPSGMAAVLGADLNTAVSVVAARQEIGGRLQIANINAPGQVVVAGGSADIDWLIEHGRDLGIRRSIPLKVAGAFHSSFMQPAADVLEGQVNSAIFEHPDFEVWSNVSATPYDPTRIANGLIEQVTSPVRFSDTLTGMHDGGISTFVHVGPGDVTAGLARKTVPGAKVLVVSSLKDIPPALAALGTM